MTVLLNAAESLLGAAVLAGLFALSYALVALARFFGLFLESKLPPKKTPPPAVRETAPPPEKVFYLLDEGGAKKRTARRPPRLTARRIYLSDDDGSPADEPSDQSRSKR